MENFLVFLSYVEAPCENIMMLKSVLFIKKILEMVFIIIPIALIVMISFDFFKNVIANREDEMKKNLNIVFKRLIFVVCLFLVPTIVSVVINIVDNAIPKNNGYKKCFNVTEEKIKSQILKNKSNCESNTGYTWDDSNYSCKIPSTPKQWEDSSDTSNKKIIPSTNQNDSSNTDNSSNNNSTNDTSNSSSGDSTSSNSNNSNSNITGDKYYSPIQSKDKITKFGKKGSTPGCSNSTRHDLSVPVGVSIYAPMDGKAEYSQMICGDYLHSYGNKIKLTASDGTYIIFAHLSGFANGVKTSVTKTCETPCSVNSCPSGKKKVESLKTINVKKGDLIGYSGSTGNSTGPHLHVEIHEGGGKKCVSDPFKAFGLK